MDSQGSGTTNQGSATSQTGAAQQMQPDMMNLLLQRLNAMQEQMNAIQQENQMLRQTAVVAPSVTGPSTGAVVASSVTGPSTSVAVASSATGPTTTTQEAPPKKAKTEIVTRGFKAPPPELLPPPVACPTVPAQVRVPPVPTVHKQTLMTRPPPPPIPAGRVKSVTLAAPLVQEAIMVVPSATEAPYTHAKAKTMNKIATSVADVPRLTVSQFAKAPPPPLPPM